MGLLYLLHRDETQSNLTTLNNSHTSFPVLSLYTVLCTVGRKSALLCQLCGAADIEKVAATVRRGCRHTTVCGEVSVLFWFPACGGCRVGDEAGKTGQLSHWKSVLVEKLAVSQLPETSFARARIRFLFEDEWIECKPSLYFSLTHWGRLGSFKLFKRPFPGFF